jgi:hypothetical protein
LRVIGNSYFVGEWKEENALLLTTTPETFPRWEAVVKFDTDSTIEYKYIAKNKPQESPVPTRWEDIPVININ